MNEDEMNENQKIVDQLINERFNSSTMLVALLNAHGPLTVNVNDLKHMLDFEKIDKDVQQFPYEPGFMDYLVSVGAYVGISYDRENNTMTFENITKDEGERRLGKDIISYICSRRKWSNK